jgi:hypothetical protein
MQTRRLFKRSSAADRDAVIPAEFAKASEAQNAGKLNIVPVFLMKIKRQMHGIELHAVFLEERRSPCCKEGVFLRSPFDPVVDDEELDSLLLRFFKGRDAGIDGKADFCDFPRVAGTHLKPVHGSVADLFDPERFVQKIADVLDGCFLHR